MTILKLQSDKRNLFKLALLAVLLLIIILNAYTIFQLATGSYKIQQNELFQLDTLQLQSKAYEYKGGIRSTSRFELNDTSGFKFKLEGASYNALINHTHLSDTLCYDGVNFIPFTDKEGFQLFQKRIKDETIYIYQLKIGDQFYVNVDKANYWTRRMLLARIVIFALVYVFAVLIYKKQSPSLV